MTEKTNFSGFFGIEKLINLKFWLSFVIEAERNFEVMLKNFEVKSTNFELFIKILRLCQQILNNLSKF